MGETDGIEETTAAPQRREIPELWVWTMTTPDGAEEGIVHLATTHGGPPVPALATDLERVADQEPFIRAAAAEHGQAITLRHFVPAEDDGLRQVAPPHLS